MQKSTPPTSRFSHTWMKLKTRPGKLWETSLDCMDAGIQVQLLVEILNHYVLFYEINAHLCSFSRNNLSTIIFDRLGTQISRPRWLGRWLVLWRGKWEALRSQTWEWPPSFFFIQNFQEGDEKQQIGQHFTNSLQHMRLRRDAEGSNLYQGLKL